MPPDRVLGRRLAKQVRDTEADAGARRLLEANAATLIAESVDRAVRAVAGLSQVLDECGSVDFLLDDQFGSPELMDLLPPERVAAMLADRWERAARAANRAGGTPIPVLATVVSEKSLTGGALALIGESEFAAAGRIEKDYRGIDIAVPLHARGYSGETIPSCPLLAAAWQMWRLGQLPAGRDLVQWWGEPPAGSDRTFTMLSTSLMHVEAAVAAILAEAPGAQSAGPARGEIGYLFKPEHW